MRGVTVDPATRRATRRRAAPSGRTWTRRRCRTTSRRPAGTFWDTGVGGLTLSGGLGYLMGTAGLTCDNLMRADGRHRDGDVVEAGPDGRPGAPLGPPRRRRQLRDRDRVRVPAASRSARWQVGRFIAHLDDAADALEGLAAFARQMPDEIVIFVDGTVDGGRRAASSERSDRSARPRRLLARLPGHALRRPKRHSLRSRGQPHWSGEFEAADLRGDPERRRRCPSACATTGRATSCAISTDRPPKPSSTASTGPAERIVVRAARGHQRAALGSSPRAGPRSASARPAGTRAPSRSGRTRRTTTSRSAGRGGSPTGARAVVVPAAPAMPTTPRPTRPPSACAAAFGDGALRAAPGRQAPLRPGQRLPVQPQRRRPVRQLRDGDPVREARLVSRRARRSPRRASPARSPATRRHATRAARGGVGRR